MLDAYQRLFCPIRNTFQLVCRSGNFRLLTSCEAKSVARRSFCSSDEHALQFFPQAMRKEAIRLRHASAQCGTVSLNRWMILLTGRGGTAVSVRRCRAGRNVISGECRKNRASHAWQRNGFTKITVKNVLSMIPLRLERCVRLLRQCGQII